MTPDIDLVPILPELILIGTGILVLLGGAIVKRAAPAALLVVSLPACSAPRRHRSRCGTGDGGLTVLAGAVAVDRFAVVARLVILTATAVGLLYGHHYFERSGEGKARAVSAACCSRRPG